MARFRPPRQRPIQGLMLFILGAFPFLGNLPEPIHAFENVALVCSCDTRLGPLSADEGEREDRRAALEEAASKPIDGPILTALKKPELVAPAAWPLRGVRWPRVPPPPPPAHAKALIRDPPPA